MFHHQSKKPSSIVHLATYRSLLFGHQIAVLQDDNKALERHLKLKETALVEAGNILRSALERALIVEDVQNQNIELKKQMEIYHVSTWKHCLIAQQQSLCRCDVVGLIFP
jgi:hypothetical protein